MVLLIGMMLSSLILASSISQVHAPFILNYPISVNNITITPLYPATINSYTLYPGNNTITIYANGQELVTGFYNFNFNATGASTVNIFSITPLVVVSKNIATQTYVNGRLKFVYGVSGGNENVCIQYVVGLCIPSSEPGGKQVLFRDDFIYQNPFLSSFWAVDEYYNPGTAPSPPGLFTTGGYLVMISNNSTATNARSPMIQSAHVITPAYTSPILGIGNYTLKRKLTVTLIPFQNKDSLVDGVWTRAGFAPLLKSGSNPPYPIPTPPPYRGVAGDVNIDGSRDCLEGQGATENFGIEYLEIGSAGTVNAVSCGVSGNQRTQLEILNPTLYTVLTVEYGGIAPSQQRVWTYYRVYQSDSSGNIISGTDKQLNVTDTAKQSPLYQSNYMFLGQVWTTNPNPKPALSQAISSFDFINLQNYGSPVDFSINNRPFPNPNKGIIGLFAQLAIWMGQGDNQFGAFYVYLLFLMLLDIPVAFYTRHVFPTVLVGVDITAMFAYGGLLPPFVTIIIILASVLLIVIVFRAIFLSQRSAFGGGGQQEEPMGAGMGDGGGMGGEG